MVESVHKSIAIEFANEHVSKLEEIYIQDLVDQFVTRRIRAQICGCKNCKKDARIAGENFMDEAWRVYQDDVTEESKKALRESPLEMTDFSQLNFHQDENNLDPLGRI
jgi:hypothetical protein